MLSPFAENLWELDAPLSVFGMSLGHRMTVARLTDGSLWIHSPVAHSHALAAALAHLGPVAHVVAPNCMHDTYLEGWFAAYPAARFHGAENLRQHRPDLKFTDTLLTVPSAAWADVFDQHTVAGMPRLNEVVFLHRASRTLIITDLAFNLGPEMPRLSRVLLRLNGCDNCFAVSRLLRSTIKAPQALRASLEHIFAWDFDRLILSHGQNLTAHAKDTLRLAFAFVP